MRNVAYWWVWFWAQILGVGVAYYYGIIHMLWTADVSRISVAILTILVVGTIDVGIRTHRAVKGLQVTEPTFSWFLADTATVLGMIGTLIGFILMVSSAIGDLSGVVNDETLKTMLTSLTSGIGTAVWTTLVGLIVSLSIKFQLVNLETVNENKKADDGLVVLLEE